MHEPGCCAQLLLVFRQQQALRVNRRSLLGGWWAPHTDLARVSLWQSMVVDKLHNLHPTGFIQNYCLHCDWCYCPLSCTLLQVLSSRQDR
jgi:hypothetical protein